jgi:hypothetical protein
LRYYENSSIGASITEKYGIFENEEVRNGAYYLPTLFLSSDLSRAEWLTLGVIGLAQFCSQVTFSCIVPFFPTEAAQKGVSTTQIGLLIGIFQLVSFLAAPVLGKFVRFHSHI